MRFPNRYGEHNHVLAECSIFRENSCRHCETCVKRIVSMCRVNIFALTLAYTNVRTSVMIDPFV